MGAAVGIGKFKPNFMHVLCKPKVSPSDAEKSAIVQDGLA